MKHVRLVSDIHLDFDIGSFESAKRWAKSTGEPVPTDEMDMLWYPEPMEGDSETCLVVAGDMWHKRKFLSRVHPSTGKSWMDIVSGMFKYVVFVLGNHDYWGANLKHEPSRVREEIAARGLNNVYLIEQNVLVLDQVKFVGGTLWTDFDRGNPLVMMRAPMSMNDYKYIRDGDMYGKLRPSSVAGVHQSTKYSIFENAKRDSEGQRVICVTHMAPSSESIDPVYRNAVIDDHNFYYFSNLTSEMTFEDHDIELWLHGHTHHPSDYFVGKTRVVCNPRGYTTEDTGWSPNWRYDV